MRWNLLFVVHIFVEEERVRIISARKTTRSEKLFYENLRKRLERDMQMTSVTIRMLDDVIDDLKNIAPLRIFLATSH